MKRAKKRKARLTPTVSPTPFPAPLTVSPNQSKSEYTSCFFSSFFFCDISPPSPCSSFSSPFGKEEEAGEEDVRGSKENEPAPPVTPAAVPPRSPLPRADVVSPTVLPRPLVEEKGLNRLVRGLVVGAELGMLSGYGRERGRGVGHSPGGTTSCLPNVFCGREIALAEFQTLWEEREKNGR